MKLNHQELKDLTFSKGRFCKDLSLEEAFAFTQSIATTHYENFPVGSLLIPKKQRQHIFNVYAFARIADDIADEPEIGVKKERLSMLESLENLLYIKNNHNPLSIALQHTIDYFNLPKLPFQKLIRAFKMDIAFEQPNSYEDLLYYCEHSANPVGELVLRIFGQYNEQRAILSDKICTALQLANFWQDLSIDVPRGRVYLPNEVLKKHSVMPDFYKRDNLKKNLPNLMLCLGELYKLTYSLFSDGRLLIKYLEPQRLKYEIKITLMGGETILKKSVKLKENIFTIRPKLDKKDFVRLILKSFF